MVPIARSTGRDLVNTKENLAPPLTTAATGLAVAERAVTPARDVARAGGLRGVDGFGDHAGRALTGTGPARAQPDPGQYRGGGAGGDRGGQWRQSLTQYLFVRDLRVPERSALFGAALDRTYVILSL